METKKCSKCGEAKDQAEFFRMKSSKDGLQSQCKKCTRECHKAWVAANPDRAKALGKARSCGERTVREVETARIKAVGKTCCVCGELKHLSEFEFFDTRAQRWSDDCLSCRKNKRLEHQRKYRAANKGVKAAENARYRNKNREKVKAIKKLYVENNREKVNAYRRKWYMKNKQTKNLQGGTPCETDKQKGEK